jgi:hypothetical protein
MKYILTLIIALIMLSCNENDTATIVTPPAGCGNMPIGLANSDSLRIIAIMPNPAGDDDNAEYFIVKNFGNASLNLSNFYIKDNDGIRWDFRDITINKCNLLTLFSNKSAELLNAGDEVSLYNSMDVKIQTVNYTDAKDGVEIRFDN